MWVACYQKSTPIWCMTLYQCHLLVSSRAEVECFGTWFVGEKVDSQEFEDCFSVISCNPTDVEVGHCFPWNKNTIISFLGLFNALNLWEDIIIGLFDGELLTCSRTHLNWHHIIKLASMLTHPHMVVIIYPPSTHTYPLRIAPDSACVEAMLIT